MSQHLFYELERRYDREIFYGSLGFCNGKSYLCYQDDNAPAVWNEKLQCHFPAEVTDEYDDLVGLSKDWLILNRQEVTL